MGRIKTTFVKRRTKELLTIHGDAFSKDFTENKQRISKYAVIQSKKIRNIMAGYVTRLKRAEK
jgi:small subunit ribosomal protein S17e